MLYELRTINNEIVKKKRKKRQDFAWELWLEQFNGAHAQIELVHVMLAEVANPQLATVVPDSRRRVQHGRQDFQQRRFTSAVLAHLL